VIIKSLKRERSGNKLVSSIISPAIPSMEKKK
jgi:hypothetical protein